MYCCQLSDKLFAGIWQMLKYYCAHCSDQKIMVNTGRRTSQRLYREKRLKHILEAMLGCVGVGKDIPAEWIDELALRLNEGRVDTKININPFGHHGSSE